MAASSSAGATVSNDGAFKTASHAARQSGHNQNPPTRGNGEGVYAAGPRAAHRSHRSFMSRPDGGIVGLLPRVERDPAGA